MTDVTHGTGPVVLGMPHTGTDVPVDIFENLNDRGRALADTDWHIDRLYNGLQGDVTVVRTGVHRYVVDCNRAPDGASLYPGQNTTGLVPLTDFDGMPIWKAEPDAEEVERRRATYHAPYHAALSTELARVKALHGAVVLLDCHSIRSVIPHLFDGKLPDFNIGTNSSTSCAQIVEDRVVRICKTASAYSTVVNKRFKGGWTTRHYGRPAAGVHAIQMELSQATYLTAEASPWPYDSEKAAHVRPYLANIISALSALVETGELT